MINFIELYFILWLVLIVFISKNYLLSKNQLIHYSSIISNKKLGEEILKLISKKYENTHNLFLLKLLIVNDDYLNFNHSSFNNNFILITLNNNKGVFSNIINVLKEIGNYLYAVEYKNTNIETPFSNHKDLHINQQDFSRKFVNDNLLYCIKSLKNKGYLLNNYK